MISTVFPRYDLEAALWFRSRHEGGLPMMEVADRLRSVVGSLRDAGETAWSLGEMVAYSGMSIDDCIVAASVLKEEGLIKGPGVVVCDDWRGKGNVRVHYFTLSDHEMNSRKIVGRLVQQQLVRSGVEVPRRKPVAPRSVRSGRIQIDAETRTIVWNKSHGFCWYCGIEMHPFTNFHVDHVWPVADGGSNQIDNLVPCCKPCNSRKATRPAEYLRDFMADGVFWFEREVDVR